MMNMTEQRGVTFIGWCIILAIIAFFVLITLRLFPLYNEKFKVIAAMNSVASRPEMADAPSDEIRKYFLRTVEVGGSLTFTDRNVKELVKIEKPEEKGGSKLLNVNFEMRNKFFHDIEFVLVFDRSVPLKGSGEGG